MKLIPKLLTTQSIVERHAPTAVLSLILLFVRVVWGYAFFLTGKGKLMNHERVTEFFSSIGIPMAGANAWMVGSLECFGGLLLLIGLFARPVSFLLTCNMIVAYITTERDAFGPLFNDGKPDKIIAADPFWFLVASIIVLAFGPGKISLDALIKWILVRAFGKEHPASGLLADSENPQHSTTMPVTA